MSSTNKRDNESERQTFGVRLPEHEIDEIDRIVYETSGPHTDVKKADILRAACRDYLKKHQGNLEECDPWENGDLPSKASVPIVTKFEKREIQAIEKVAYECSSPKRDISKSDVLRAAIRDYIDKHDNGVRECKPKENGGIEFPFENL